MALAQKRKLAKCKKCGYMFYIDESLGVTPQCPICGSNELDITEQETEVTF